MRLKSMNLFQTKTSQLLERMGQKIYIAKKKSLSYYHCLFYFHKRRYKTHTKTEILNLILTKMFACQSLCQNFPLSGSNKCIHLCLNDPIPKWPTKEIDEVGNY